MLLLFQRTDKNLHNLMIPLPMVTILRPYQFLMLRCMTARHAYLVAAGEAASHKLPGRIPEPEMPSVSSCQLWAVALLAFHKHQVSLEESLHPVSNATPTSALGNRSSLFARTFCSFKSCPSSIFFTVHMWWCIPLSHWPTLWFQKYFLDLGLDEWQLS